MIPIKFPEQNVTFKHPDPNCGDLPAFQDDSVIVSCWELTDEDLEAVNSSRKIWVGIRGKVLQPMWIITELPFVDNTEFPEVIGECDALFDDGNK